MDKKQITQLEKLLFYILAVRPDEFGLVLDDEGWVPAKELVGILQEEPLWRFMRLGYLKEAFSFFAAGRFEVSADEMLVRVEPAIATPVLGREIPLPRIVYMAVRRKTYPHVLEKGLRPVPGQRYLVAAVDEELALRMGKRRDQEPVLIKIDTQVAAAQGTTFLGYYELLFLFDVLPPEVVSGPQPKARETRPPERPKKPRPGPAPLSGLGDHAPLAPFLGKKSGRDKDKMSWKKERKRRQKKEWF